MMGGCLPMGAFTMWWMLWWRLVVTSAYLGFEIIVQSFIIAGVTAPIIALRAKRTIVIFPIIRMWHGDGAIEYRWGFPEKTRSQQPVSS